MIRAITPATVELHDYAPEPADLVAECLAGLRASPRTLPCKFFYDRRGSQLFDQICELPEYYPTRTELGIMYRCIHDIASRLGQRCLLIELGSGSSLKTRVLLRHLAGPAGYVPIDISREHLLDAARELANEFPQLPIMPVCADYLQPMRIPSPPRQVARRILYFPGSTIGNFHPHEARAFLRRLAQIVKPNGGLLIGVDLRKSPDLLLPAYNDAQGITAAFNLNLLARINREADANFNLSQFQHKAIWNDAHSRVEMHLIAIRDQAVTVAGERFYFSAGDSICTECSYKHTVAGFAELAEDFEVQAVWTDSQRLFSVQYLGVG